MATAETITAVRPLHVDGLVSRSRPMHVSSRRCKVKVYRKALPHCVNVQRVEVKGFARPAAFFFRESYCNLLARTTK